MTAKYRSESKYASTEIGLKPENQRTNVRTSIYNIEDRLQNVTKRINSSPKISPHNRELIWKFAEHCKIQGLLKEAAGQQEICQTYRSHLIRISLNTSAEDEAVHA